MTLSIPRRAAKPSVSTVAQLTRPFPAARPGIAPALPYPPAATAVRAEPLPLPPVPPEDVPAAGGSWAARYGWRLLAGDAIAVAWAAFGAHLVHMGSVSTQISRDPDKLPFIALTLGLAVAWMLALHWNGTRDEEVIGHGPEEYKRVVQTSVGLFGLVAISSYVFNLHLPRAYVLVMLPAGLVALMLGRFTWRRWLHSHRLNGRFMSMVLVVGNIRTVRELLTDLRRALDAILDPHSASASSRDAMIGPS